MFQGFVGHRMYLPRYDMSTDRAGFRPFNQYACQSLHKMIYIVSKNKAKARHVRGHGLHNMFLFKDYESPLGSASNIRLKLQISE